MSPADINTKTVKVAIVDQSDSSNIVSKHRFVAKDETILFDGFMKVYSPSKESLSGYQTSNDDTEDTEGNTGNNILSEHAILIRDINEGEFITLKTLVSKEKTSKPPYGRFTEASLVKKLDELGIGRPSTYSSMVSIVQDRNYAIRKDIEAKLSMDKVLTFSMDSCEIVEETIEQKINGEKNKLVPTDIGMIVNTFLDSKMSELLDVGFTVNLESLLDQIAQGKNDYISVVRFIYDKFEPKYNEIAGTLSPEKNKYSKSLGKDPYTGKEIVTYIAKYGPVVCLKADRTNKKDKDRYISLKDSGLDIKMVSLSQAVELLKYPYELCQYKNKPVLICKGKYGLYFKYNDKNWTLKGASEPQTVEDIELYFTKNSETENTNGTIKTINESISIKTGKWGPYILYKKKGTDKPKFINLGGIDPESLTKEKCMEIISNYKPKSYYKYTKK